MASLIGKILKNRYKVIKSLGHGSKADVYLASDKLLETEVAIKVIQTDNIQPKVMQRGLKRFHIEAQRMAALNHPNIVKVMDHGEHEGIPYLVIPNYASGTLKDWLGTGMPYEKALRLILPVADALAYAHSKGLVHRKVKPSNILLTEGDLPMLTDFGLVKMLGGEETLDLTGIGAWVGKPKYMAPEQADGRVIDAWTDIYALGVVLYEQLTAWKPFETETPVTVLVKHMHDPLPKPSEIISGIPESVEQLLYKTLAIQPGERY